MRKYLFLVLSILWTVIILSFSTQSGESSASLSYQITLFIHTGIKPLFPSIDIEVLHLDIRKCAHVGEYAILGILYTITGISFQLKRWFLLPLGLFVALIDEGLQYFSIERGPSLIDALLYDFPGYLLGMAMTLIIYRIFHKI